jgi:hypothetical protein
MRYVVRLGNQDLVVVIRPSLTEKWVDVGEDVTLGFPAEKTHVFPYPEAGLMEEISA